MGTHLCFPEQTLKVRPWTSCHRSEMIGAFNHRLRGELFVLVLKSAPTL